MKGWNRGILYNRRTEVVMGQERSTIWTESLVNGHCCCLVAKVVSNSFATPYTVAHQAPLSMRFPRQKHELPFPFQGVFPTQQNLGGGSRGKGESYRQIKTCAKALEQERVHIEEPKGLRECTTEKEWEGRIPGGWRELDPTYVCLCRPPKKFDLQKQL